MTRLVALVLVYSLIGCAGSSSRPDEFTGAIEFVHGDGLVFTVDAATSTVTRTGLPSGSRSPDGATVAYATPEGEVRLADASGGGERTLGRRGYCYAPVFSPDGAHLVCDYTEPNVITVLDADDGSLVARTADCCWVPVWSPDGSEIAYFSLGTYDPTSGFVGPSGVFVMKTDGTRKRRVSAREPDYNTASAWSSRGVIAFISTNGQIWTVSPSGKGLRRLGPADLNARGALTWSPDGTKLAFTGGDGDFEVFVINADGTGLKNLTNNEKIQDEEPSWSPDGRAIVFVSNRDEGLNQIFAMRVDGSAQTQLTDDPGGGACCPTWLPG